MKRQGLLVIALIGLILSALLPVAVQAQDTTESPGGINATVIAPVLRLRRAPRLSSSFRAVLHKGEQVTAVGRDQSGAWLLVLSAEGNGWVDRTWVLPEDKPYYLPVSHVFPPFVSALSADGVNVREGPSDKYSVITILPKGVEVDVIAVHRPRPVWYKVVLEDGRTGWVYSNSVFAPGNLNFTPDDDAPPRAQIVVYNLRVHSAPDVNAQVLGDVRLDSQFTIIGRDDRGNWLQIAGKFGSGWIWAHFAVVIGPLEAAPIVVGNPGPTILH